MVTGCDFCLFKLPCRCSISTNNYYYAPRLASCHQNIDNIATLHPVNLALLQKFFDTSFVKNILADTTVNKALNVTLPNLKLYQHKMSNVIAADTKSHLSLSKMTATAKKYAVIFQSLAEPLLDGQIQLDSDWPNTDNILLYITTTATILLTTVLALTILKLRKLVTALLVLEKVQKAKSMVTELPSFIYKANSNIPNKESSTINFSIDLTWDQANFILLSALSFVFIAILWKHYQFKIKSKLCLEITCGEKCVWLDNIQLPMCPTYYNINVPTSISDLEIKGPWYSPKLYVSWPDFTIKNTLTDEITNIKSEINISIWTAFQIRQVLGKTFFVYMYRLHHSIMFPIRHP